MDLVIIIIISLLLVPLTLFTSGGFRIAFGLAFVLFFPGYTLVAALFTRKGSLDGIERLALSFGLSIVVVPLVGLVLNYTPWGIGLYPILIALLLFTISMVAIAWYRRQRLPPTERFEYRLYPRLTTLFQFWGTQSRLTRVLAVLLLITITLATGALVYVVTTPKVGESFTEFYILGLEDKAEKYPQEVTLGEEGRVILGIVNQEHELTAYRVEMTIDGEKATQMGPITLDPEEKWEQEISFSPIRAGQAQKVEFLLYKGVSTEVYQSLHFWIDVKEAP